MKRKLLLSIFALLSVTTAWADVAIDSTNFPDENFRNYLLSQSYGEDGVLTDEEIAGIWWSIDVSNKSIQNLKGIEYFTALTRLSCYGNQLTSLDVSKNTKLEWLQCFDNQLTSLDVSKNTRLEYLDCSGNQLTSLDVSGCRALITLDCRGNQLTSLDVSQNTALRNLICYSNQLTSLDVSKRTALWTLDCSYNQLTSLDVSQNTALTGLQCSGNQLTSLDVSQNTALEWLYCYHNQLTSLDVSKNTKLIILACFLNQIKDAGMDALVASLPTVSKGELYVICNENEQNVMTTMQVAAAETKGWTSYHFIGLDQEGRQIWQEYAGSEPVNTTGDLNGDFKIDIADAVSVLNIMAGGGNDPAADLNNDGKVDIADFVSVLNLMAKQ